MVQISHGLALLGLGSTALARGLPRLVYEYGATTVTVTDCDSAPAVTSYLTVTVTPEVCFSSVDLGSSTDSGLPGRSSSEVESATAAPSDTGSPYSESSTFSTLDESASPEFTTESSEGSLPTNSASDTASEVPRETGTGSQSSSPASTESATINSTSSETTCVTDPHPESTESAQPTPATEMGSDDDARTDSSSPELATSSEDDSTATSSGLFPEYTSGALTESSSPELNTSLDSSSNTTTPDTSVTAPPTSSPSIDESGTSSAAQPSETEYLEGSYDEGLSTEDSDAATATEEAWTTQNGTRAMVGTVATTDGTVSGGRVGTLRVGLDSKQRLSSSLSLPS